MEIAISRTRGQGRDARGHPRLARYHIVSGVEGDRLCEDSRTSENEQGPVAGQARFAARSALGFLGVLGAGVLFALVLSLVVAPWAPLHTVDVAVVDALNEGVSGKPWAVSALRFLTYLGGSEAAWLILPVTVVWLLVRRLLRLSAYAAVTGIGVAVLTPGMKAIIERARPVVDVPIASATGASFPSGHALGSTVAYGTLLLVFLPVVPPRFRKLFVASIIAVVSIVGLTRVALGVHHPSDVLAGWLLGVLWLAVTAAAFRRWREEEGLRRVGLAQGLAPEDRPALVPVPAEGATLPEGRRSASQLLVGWVLLWGALVGLGVLITDALEAVQRFDAAAADWFVSVRTEWRSRIAIVAGHIGSTVGIVSGLAVSSALALAVTRRWRQPLFLVLSVAGETLLFLAASTVVERNRPQVEYLSPPLPPTAAFPSGHVAASVALYGGVALLVLAWTRGWIRHAAVAWAVLAPVAVALSRLYRGVHYPSDVIASILYASVWLAVCWWVLRPGPGPLPQRSDTGALEHAPG